MKKIMASLDVGSDTIKLVVGEMIKGKLNILAVADAPSKGVKKGLITDSEEILEPLHQVFSKCEEILGLPIKQVVVTVPTDEADFVVSSGKTKVMNEDKSVSGPDIIRALQASVKGKIAANNELISIIPIKFKLDGDKIVNDPKKMISEVLAVKSVVVSAPKRTVYPILTCLEKMGIDVLDLSFGAMGDYQELHIKESDSEVGSIINLGEDITTVSIFNKGILTKISTIPYGGANIINDLSYVFKIPLVEAKNVYKKIGLAHKRLASANNVIEVTNKDGQSIKLNQYEVSEVIQSRLEEILNLSKKEINLLTKKEISYIIITGGLSEIKDFSLVLEEIYGNTATLAKVNEIGVRSNKYSSCVGMIKFYASKAKLKDKEFSIFSIEEQEELSGLHKHLSVSDSGVLGKLFGYFFDS